MANPHVSLITDIHSRLFMKIYIFRDRNLYIKSLKGMAGSTCESVQVALAGRKLLGIEMDCDR